jgi:hypothetical protein
MEGEELLAWRWEAARQKRGKGKAWLDHPIRLRRKWLQSLGENRQVPAREIRGLVDELPRNISGNLLLTLDIDCGFSAKDIAAWLEGHLVKHPLFNATAKAKAGRRNDFKAWLRQLAATRLLHAGKSAEQIASLIRKHFGGSPSPEDIHAWRRDTMKRLSEAKS